MMTGYWNDLDFLMVGYKELKDWEDPQTLEEYRSQYSLFAILAAPVRLFRSFLLVSVGLFCVVLLTRWRLDR